MEQKIKIIIKKAASAHFSMAPECDSQCLLVLKSWPVGPAKVLMLIEKIMESPLKVPMLTQAYKQTIST